MYIADIGAIPGISAEEFSPGIFEIAVTGTPVSFTLCHRGYSRKNPFGSMVVGGLAWLLSTSAGVGIVGYLGDEKDILPYTKQFFKLLHAHNPLVTNIIPLKVMSVSETGDSAIVVNLLKKERWLLSFDTDQVFDIVVLDRE